MATHSSTLAWKIPWAEKPGRLQSMGSLRVGHDWVTSLSLFTFMHWRRKWQPTAVFLPGESQVRRSLVGWRLWGSHRVGHDWNDLAAAAESLLHISYQYVLGFSHLPYSFHVNSKEANSFNKQWIKGWVTLAFAVSYVIWSFRYNIVCHFLESKEALRIF